MQSRWIGRLRVFLAYVLAVLLTMAAFGAVLAVLWAVLPRSLTLWRLGSVLLSAGLAVALGGATLGWIIPTIPRLHGGIFGVVLAAVGSIYILGPSLWVPVISLGFGSAAIAGAAASQRWRRTGPRAAHS